tara:strand:+ start:340 stop:771 length:432 start_codon:yes stop_codon:yes gene_type:complete
MKSENKNLNRGYIMIKKIYNKGDTFSFVKDMVVPKTDNHGLTSDFLWKIANYRNAEDDMWVDSVIDWNIRSAFDYKRKSDGKVFRVSPIYLHHKGENGFTPLKDGAGDDIKILMTKEEVEIFNENFTDPDYKDINFKAVVNGN